MYAVNSYQPRKLNLVLWTAAGLPSSCVGSNLKRVVHCQRARALLLSLFCPSCVFERAILVATLPSPSTAFKQYLRTGRSSNSARMDALIQQSIKAVQTKAKRSVPWKPDTPQHQPYYTFSSPGNASHGDWVSVQSPSNSEPSSNLELLALYSWNIDFMLPHSDSRMRIGLRHLESLVGKLPSTTTTVIFFQECLESDLQLIASDPWVQKTFQITDLDANNWLSGHYGTTSLIDKRLPIEACFRVHYSRTRMERDGFFVDLKVGHDSVIRLCNTHLESLALEPPLRPSQMEVCSQYMRDKGIRGAVVAGDFNAIQEFDRRLHSVNGLKDAYLEVGGREDDAEGGHTWGQQAATAQRKRFGTSRMDKMFYCGDLVCRSFERFGMDVVVEDARERKDIVKLGFEKPYITDHLGVKAVFGLGAVQGKTPSV